MALNMEAMKEKAGPLPVWGWVVIISVLGYYIYKKHQVAQQNAADNSPTDVAGNQIVEDPAMQEQLNTTNAALATLATNVGKQTTATTANTTATAANTGALNTNTASEKQNTGAVTTNTKVLTSNTSALKARPAPRPAPKPSPKPVARKYKVVSGDNLSKIAQRYHTTWQAIYNVNKRTIGSNPNLIKPGQVLVIP